MTKRIASLTLSITALLLVGCGDSLKDELTAALEDSSPELIEPAHSEPTVLDAEGIKTLRAETAAKGQVLVIDVWATWCPSCVQMFPKLHAAMKERGDSVKLVSLSYDEGDEFVGQAKAFLEAHDAMHDAYFAVGGDAKDDVPAALGGSWEDAVLPAVFVYDTGGNLVHEMLETEGDIEAWVAGIAAAVDKAAAQ